MNNLKQSLITEAVGELDNVTLTYSNDMGVWKKRLPMLLEEIQTNEIREFLTEIVAHTVDKTVEVIKTKTCQLHDNFYLDKGDGISASCCEVMCKLLDSLKEYCKDCVASSDPSNLSMVILCNKHKEING